MKNRIFLYLFLLLTQSAFAQSHKVTVEDLFIRYLEIENESMAKMIINSNDSLYSLFCKAALAKNETEAIDLYSEFISLNPKYGLAEAYFNRGVKYNWLEMAKLSIEDFDKYMEYDNKNPYAYYFRGNSFAVLDEYDKAIKDYSVAIEIEPTFDLAYLMRGNCYFDKKDYNEALLDYNKTLILDKKSDQAYIMRGLVYEATEEYKKAISDWEKVKDISPENTEVANKLIERVSEKEIVKTNGRIDRNINNRTER